ncbi:MAG: PEP-CTERM sorting domain-containing protein [Armatimonadota bacterium]|nr:PEP-CTERM sorting domain-containing protein [Armatimonadota bacterium]
MDSDIRVAQQLASVIRSGGELARFAGWRIDDVQLVLVPKPSSLLALAAGGLGALLWRRCRSK